LIESLTVYGFGSFFNGNRQPNDIDLLLMHSSTALESCKFAVDCKAQLKLAVPSADIVMLSQEEAKSLDFLKRAKAVRLTSLSFDTIEADVQALANRLLGVCT
jgi:hypothetical protein